MSPRDSNDLVREAVLDTRRGLKMYTRREDALNELGVSEDELERIAP
jgi:hypothetical protein